MPVESTSKYLQSILDNLIGSHEIETNYHPFEIELDKHKINAQDMNTLLEFVNEPRKRLFIFKIPEDEASTALLGFRARRAVLNYTARAMLKSTSSEPKINPLKYTLQDPGSSVRAGIQIQKSFILSKKPNANRDEQSHQKITVSEQDLKLQEIVLPELPQLAEQLKALDILWVEESAMAKINAHPHAFTDGIIVSNLPEGFYINKAKQALCYTKTPQRLPSALAPRLENPVLIQLPELDKAKVFLPELDGAMLEKLLDSGQLEVQKKALLAALVPDTKEILSVFQALKSEELGFVVPMLAKYLIMGGQAHTRLVIRLLKSCINKKVGLAFLKDPISQDALLNPRGIKNLQKLLELPAEQKEWWNKLAGAHLRNPKHYFDFNHFFEAYFQIVIPGIVDKNLTLPNPCPVTHEGHFLVTLNRVLEVINHAENPQEQCLSFDSLDWGPTGAHHAMVDAAEHERLKHVASCMKVSKPEDLKTKLGDVYSELEKEGFNLEPWIFRYLGQHWNKEIRLTEIQAQLGLVQSLPNWVQAQKNQLKFVIACTFLDAKPLDSKQWTDSVAHSISLLQSLNEDTRLALLQGFTRCFQFKPRPTLTQINSWIDQCVELKVVFQDKAFYNDLIIPLVSCLENEGLDFLNTLKERVQKTDPNPEERRYSLTAMMSYMTLLHANRSKLQPEMIQLLVKLNESELNQANIDALVQSMIELGNTRGESYSKLLLSVLSQINIAKSQTLPNFQNILDLIKTLSESAQPIPPEFKTSDKQETWLKDLILDKNLLPGCVLGTGDISKLDDLIVDALVDAIKKRSSVLKIKRAKEALQTSLQNKFVPDQLKQQLDQELMPMFDVLNDLVELLQSPNPKFDTVISTLAILEERKPILLEGDYKLSILGNSKGKFLLSFLLTGKRREDDTITGAVFGRLLVKLHGLLVEQITAFFENENNRLLVQDLDAKTTLSWLTALNDTHSISFLFKEELLHKKVLPALKKTLLQLNTQDTEFENSILASAADFEEHKPSHELLKNYKIKIESIESYLNLLIDIKETEPDHFKSIYKQLQTGPLSRLNYNQKQTLIHKLIQASPRSLNLYLKLMTQALEDNPEVNEAAIDRAIGGLVALFDIKDLESDTQTMFFKMSLAHNLKSTSAFPITDLNELKQSALPEDTKVLMIKTIIQLLSHMSDADSPDLIKGLVQQTQHFLTQNADQAPLCIALLKRISFEDLSRDLTAYPNILQQLTQLNPEHRRKLTTVLTGMAQSKKDDTVNLPSLLDITKGLGRRSAVDLDTVVSLFVTPPYPIAQTLNSALLVHGSEKLQAYCLSFDTNPFTKLGETRALAKQFETERIEAALWSLKDLMQEVDIPHTLQLQLARQLTYIETLGYTDPLKPGEFTGLKKLTALSRKDLKDRVSFLLNQLRSKSVPPEALELIQLELLAYLREIYFRTTGLFPNTTQMLMLLISLNSQTSNVLMSIKTGEGKSLITPMLAVLQWTQGGTVDVCTANTTLLGRDYENNCEPFFKFLGIESSLIHSNSHPNEYKLGGINCSTLEDIALFRLAAKESGDETCVQNENPIHVVLDECDDALLDQTILYKLVAQTSSLEPKEENPAQWVYPLAYQFINRQAFRNVDHTQGEVWDEEADLEQFRIYLNKEINEQFQGDAEKINFMMGVSNTELKQWINASCKAAKLIEDKHFIVQTIKEKNDLTNETRHRMVCVPLQRSTPKTGCIFTTGIQQALHARLMAERKEMAHLFVIDADPPVLASQSARGLIQFYQSTKGRLVGISGTPGDYVELQYLNTLFGTKAIGVDPYAGDQRVKHAPIFTFSKEESLYEIEKAINAIRKPVTIPSLEINPNLPIQTIEEKEALAVKTNEIIDTWNQTQTQPVLIVCEDFEEAQVFGKRLDFYKQSGFKIQVVTGKEPPEKLAKIIKQAGRASTITIGTAMLARGIDINTGTHPQGLFVIQTYPESERMTTQIGGRAARNGKPGEWLPIYQVQAPQHFISKFLYSIFPWFRQSDNLKAVNKLQRQMKLQAEVDRLYTQAVDQAQQVLMQHIHAWESLLLELHQNDPKLKHELYQWREALLGELTQLQETSISQKTLQTSIARFKNAIEKLWESAKEEKWVASATKVAHLTTEQHLKLHYLKHLNVVNELNIQSKLQPVNTAFKEGTGALMHQNLETTILDKAGAVLNYTKPSDQEKSNLHLAQAKQLIPNLIGDLCLIYPKDIKKFNLNTNDQGSIYLPVVVNKLIKKLVEQKNRALMRAEDKQQIIDAISQLYRERLRDADAETLTNLLEKIKEIILVHSNHFEQVSLIERFKMQGIILNFCTLYNNLNRPKDDQFLQLEQKFGDHIMSRLADYLIDEFAWAIQLPQPWHARFERKVVKDAARDIYALADAVRQSADSKEAVQALYKGLQKHQVILQNKYLCSINHRCPRQVIHLALNAIASLNRIPHCDKEFQANSHDEALSNYHVQKFRITLETISLSYVGDPVWSDLRMRLMNIIKQDGNDQIHRIFELSKTIERFNRYVAYKPYQSQLKTMNSQLEKSQKEFETTYGLQRDMESSLFNSKAKSLASFFKMSADDVRIRRSSDGIDSYIEVQVEQLELQEGYTGYESSVLSLLGKESQRIATYQAQIAEHEPNLVRLLDPKVCDLLPPEHQEAFKNLFKLKGLVDKDWNESWSDEELALLPNPSQIVLRTIQELKQIDLASKIVDLDNLQRVLGKKPDDAFLNLLSNQYRIVEYLEHITAEQKRLNSEIDVLERAKSTDQGKVDSNIKQQGTTNVANKLILKTSNVFLYSKISSLNTEITRLKEACSKLEIQEGELSLSLNSNTESIGMMRNELTMNLVGQGKLALTDYVHETSQQLVRRMQAELKNAERTCVQFKQLERNKSQYQTHRFFNCADLLRYEANLRKEEETIPLKKPMAEYVAIPVDVTMPLSS